jgi:hypothetical protein
MKVINQITVTTLFFLIFTGCSLYSSKRNAEFKKILPTAIKDLNNEIQLSIPIISVKRTYKNQPSITYLKGPDDLRVGEPITVIIKNKSKNLIVIPKESQFTILFYNEDDKQWIEINDILNNTQSDKDLELLPEGSDDPIDFKVIGVQPALLGITKPMEIRILVIGEVYENGISTKKQVGAYLDLTLHPSK